MILEGLVTTSSASGELNLAPMGPLFLPGALEFELRPFEESTTYRNLLENPCGVFHVTDDVLLIAKAAIDRLDGLPATFPASKIFGRVLQDCCRWYEFGAMALPVNSVRRAFHCKVVSCGTAREYFGLNRAKHAVLEGAIMATRLAYIPKEEIANRFAQWEPIIAKTGGPEERAAFQLLSEYVS